MILRKGRLVALAVPPRYAREDELDGSIQHGRVEEFVIFVFIEAILEQSLWLPPSSKVAHTVFGSVSRSRWVAGSISPSGRDAKTLILEEGSVLGCCLISPKFNRQCRLAKS